MMKTQQSMSKESPVREYKTIIKDSGNTFYTNRLLIGTPATGVVRVEWVQARYGQIIPVNWSMVNMMQFIDSYIPMRYQVADAQNLIVKQLVESDMEWLLLIEHDVLLPPDAFIRFNQYIDDEEVPIVSGLYFTRSHPSVPLVFRGRGTSVYRDWELGDRVWCDGVPTGCLLIHGGILREMWNDAEEYMINRGAIQDVTRRVFDSPRDIFYNPEYGFVGATSGTSDLKWCTKVMEGDYFKKAGWDKYQDMEYPFLIDTQIFCKHINMDGEQFPHFVAVLEDKEDERQG